MKPGKHSYILGLFISTLIILGCGILQSKHGPIVELVQLPDITATATLAVPPTSYYPTATVTNTPRATFTPAGDNQVPPNARLLASEPKPTFTLTPLPLIPTSTPVVVPDTPIEPTAPPPSEPRDPDIQPTPTFTPLTPDTLAPESPIPTPTFTFTPLPTNTLPPSLPTLTFTPIPTNTPIPTATFTPVPAATATATLVGPTSTSSEPVPGGIINETATPTPTLIPNVEVDGFLFSHLYFRQDNRTQETYLYGLITNNTNETLYVESIAGRFFDGNAQILVDESLVDARIPAVTLQPSEKIPFEATLETIQKIGNFELNIDFEDPEEFEAASLEIINPQSTPGGDELCVQGSVKNNGNELEYQLIVALVLYNVSDQVINFADYEYDDDDYNAIFGDTLGTFNMCAETHGQSVSRHEILVWGE